MMLDATRIMIVEDELLLAMDLEATLQEQGWHVLGPVQNVERALRLLETETPDAVCLDMNLNGETSAPVAEMLQSRSIPFVIVTGYNDRAAVHPAFAGVPLVHKPFLHHELVSLLESILAAGRESPRS